MQPYHSSVSEHPDEGGEIDRLIAEYLDQQDRGEQTDRQALLSAYPEYAVRLRTFFADGDRLAGIRDKLSQEAPVWGEYQSGDLISDRYRLLELIGEGGMGRVWLAWQQQPVQRYVAIKLINPGLDSRQILARFEAERQALAIMEHPNIARILDAGMTPAGRPFFVMEYIRGVPLTIWCDTARLGLRERLELFIPVCQAIQHAHGKGIIHRDLKPSNILVCLYEGVPGPRVIDFGLARALTDDVVDECERTLHGQMVGTPLYMSPEQADFGSSDIDARTDVYSLGVVLYELLTGTTPLSRAELQRASLERVLQLIRNTDPVAPSLRVSEGGVSPDVAGCRATDLSHLPRLLHGDLDWIVLRALEKDRRRRYATPASLGLDIRRYLNQEPVEAGPPGLSYRLQKWTVRHRAGLFASLLAFVVVLVISGLVRGWMLADRAVILAHESTWKERLQRSRKHARQILPQIGRPEWVGIHRMVDDGAVSSPESAALRSWSSIPEPSVRLSILESGLADDEAAVRLTRRGERVFLACSGLSRHQREAAFRLIYEIQTSSSQSPVSRLAACILAIQNDSPLVDLKSAVDAFLPLVTGLTDTDENLTKEQAWAVELRERLLWTMGSLSRGAPEPQWRVAFQRLLESMPRSSAMKLRIETAQAAMLAPGWFWGSRISELPTERRRPGSWDSTGFPASVHSLEAVAERISAEYVADAAEACMELVPYVSDVRERELLLGTVVTLAGRCADREFSVVVDRLFGCIEEEIDTEDEALPGTEMIGQAVTRLSGSMERLSREQRGQIRGRLMRKLAVELASGHSARCHRLHKMFLMSISDADAEKPAEVVEQLREFVQDGAPGGLLSRLQLAASSLGRLLARCSDNDRIALQAWLIAEIERSVARDEAAAVADGREVTFPSAGVSSSAAGEECRRLLAAFDESASVASLALFIPLFVGPQEPLPEDIQQQLRVRLITAMPEVCAQPYLKATGVDFFPAYRDLLVRLAESGVGGGNEELSESIVSLLRRNDSQPRKWSLAASVFSIPGVPSEEQVVDVWSEVIKLTPPDTESSAELLRVLASRLPAAGSSGPWSELLAVMDVAPSVSGVFAPALLLLSESQTADVGRRLRELLAWAGRVDYRTAMVATGSMEFLCRTLPEQDVTGLLEWILEGGSTLGGDSAMIAFESLAARCSTDQQNAIFERIVTRIRSNPAANHRRLAVYAAQLGKVSATSATELWLDRLRELRASDMIEACEQLVVLNALAVGVDFQDPRVLERLQSPELAHDLLPGAARLLSIRELESEGALTTAGELLDEIVIFSEYLPDEVVANLGERVLRDYAEIEVWFSGDTSMTYMAAQLIKDQQQLVKAIRDPHLGLWQRQRMMERFEELVCHGSRRMLLPVGRTAFAGTYYAAEEEVQPRFTSTAVVAEWLEDHGQEFDFE